MLSFREIIDQGIEPILNGKQRKQFAFYVKKQQEKQAKSPKRTTANAFAKKIMASYIDPQHDNSHDAYNMNNVTSFSFYSVVDELDLIGDYHAFDKVNHKGQQEQELSEHDESFFIQILNNLLQIINDRVLAFFIPNDTNDANEISHNKIIDKMIECVNIFTKTHQDKIIQYLNNSEYMLVTFNKFQDIVSNLIQISELAQLAAVQAMNKSATTPNKDKLKNALFLRQRIFTSINLLLQDNIFRQPGVNITQQDIKQLFHINLYYSRTNKFIVPILIKKETPVGEVVTFVEEILNTLDGGKNDLLQIEREEVLQIIESFLIFLQMHGIERNGFVNWFSQENRQGAFKILKMKDDGFGYAPYEKNDDQPIQDYNLCVRQYKRYCYDQVMGMSNDEKQHYVDNVIPRSNFVLQYFILSMLKDSNITIKVDLEKIHNYLKLYFTFRDTVTFEFFYDSRIEGVNMCEDRIVYEDAENLKIETNNFVQRVYDVERIFLIVLKGCGDYTLKGFIDSQLARSIGGAGYVKILNLMMKNITRYHKQITYVLQRQKENPNIDDDLTTVLHCCIEAQSDKAYKIVRLIVSDQYLFEKNKLFFETKFFDLIYLFKTLDDDDGINYARLCMLCHEIRNKLLDVGTLGVDYEKQDSQRVERVVNRLSNEDNKIALLLQFLTGAQRVAYLDHVQGLRCFAQTR